MASSELTPRQTEIAALVRQGMTSQQIGDQLGIGRRTVEAHRYQMRQRESGDALRSDLEALILTRWLQSSRAWETNADAHNIAMLLLTMETAPSRGPCRPSSDAAAPPPRSAPGTARRSAQEIAQPIKHTEADAIAAI